ATERPSRRSVPSYTVPIPPRPSIEPSSYRSASTVCGSLRVIRRQLCPSGAIRIRATASPGSVRADTPGATRCGGRPKPTPANEKVDGSYLCRVGMKEADGAEAGPRPTLFLAETVHVYVLPVVRPDTL